MMPTNAIINFYKKSPNKDTIKELAVENDCDESDIIWVLEQNGVDINTGTDIKDKPKENSKPTAIIKEKVKVKSDKSNNFKNQLQNIVDEVKTENKSEDKPKRKPGRKPGVKYNTKPIKDKTPTEVLKDADVAIENAVKALDAKIAVLEKKKELLEEALKINEV